MFHYVYAIIRNSVFSEFDFDNPWLYVGVRTSKLTPMLDKYMGSGTLISKLAAEDKSKIIISEFNSRAEANTFEREIVNCDFIKSPGVYNLIEGGGRSFSIDEDLIRLSLSEISKKYWKTSEYREKNTLDYLRTDEVKKKISDSLKTFFSNGGTPWNKNLVYNDEQCHNLKIKISKYWEQNKREYYEWKLQISNGIKTKWQEENYQSAQRNLDYLHTPAIANQISKSNKISCNTPEFKEHASKRSKDLWQNEEYKNKQNNLAYLHTEEVSNKRCAAIKDFYNSEEGHIIATERAKRNWSSEEYRAKNNLSYLRTDEVKKKISAGAKKQFSTPLICPNCGHTGKGPWMYQKHFKNCKYEEAKCS